MTGVPDDVRADLEPGNELFAHFLAAYREQDLWSHREHEMFWRSAVRLWPLRPGRRRTSDRYAHALRAASARSGLSVEAAATMLDLSLDSLRKSNPLDHARTLLGSRGDDPPPGLLSVTITDYALPRIYVPGRDATPDPDAYPNLGADALGTVDSVTQQLAAALAELGCPP